MAEKVDILAIGAHAGDAEIASGMALSAHVRQGKRIAMLHCTPGEKGHPTLSPEDYADQKREEAQMAGSVLRAQVYFLPYRDGELPVDDSVKFAICDVIRECRPDVIITHWHGSMHKDHVSTNAILQDAIFYAALNAFEREQPAHWPRALLYAENWEDPFGFQPELYLDVTSEDIATWQEMVNHYALFRNEWPSFNYVEYYRSLARVRGLEVFTEYASAFAIPEHARRRKVESLL